MERTENEAGAGLTVVSPSTEVPAQAPPPPAEPVPGTLERTVHCDRCGKENAVAARFCGGCGATLASAEAGPMAVSQKALTLDADGGLRPRGDTQYAVGKNPTVAVLLSVLIVGLGQFYNGDIKKGAVMLVGAVVLSAVTLGIAWFLVLIWSAIDAYKVAKGETPLWT